MAGLEKDVGRMKLLRHLFRPYHPSTAAVFLLLLFGAGSFAQTNTTVPVVTIRASDPFASWSGDSGAFTVFRNGPTNATLNVFYWIAGTASNGVDYASIGNYVVIPAGVRTNSIVIKPINNGQTNA